MKKSINDIVEITKHFKWKILKLWIEDNCIYAEVEKPNGKIEIEGLYASSDFDKNYVYIMFEELKKAFNIE